MKNVILFFNVTLGMGMQHFLQTLRHNQCTSKQIKEILERFQDIFESTLTYIHIYQDINIPSKL